MERWLVVFVGITAAALLLQALTLLGTYLTLRRMNRQLTDLLERFNDGLDPLMDRLDDILKTVQANSRRILDDVGVIAATARGQAEKLDRVTDELTQRLRGQVVRLDDLLSRALGAMEAAGEKVERSLAGPMREAVAVVQGVRAALDFLAQRRREGGAASSSERTEEGLFI